MIRSAIKIFFQHKKQAIKKHENIVLPNTFQGVPVLTSKNLDPEKLNLAREICPTNALSSKEFSLDMGKCLFCGECEKILPYNIEFTNNWKMWSFKRNALVVRANNNFVNPIPEQTISMFKHAVKLRSISAGGDNATEMELNAIGNVNFDAARFGMEFVASPRHADAIVITGPITKNMSRELQITYDAMTNPKFIVVAGTDAISGGLFGNSPAIDRSFLNNNIPALFIPGNPPHPLSIIAAVKQLVGK